jgi:Tfp pilus assembly protein PilN
MSRRSVRWAFPLIACAVTLAACLADFIIIERWIRDTNSRLASMQAEAALFQQQIDEVHRWRRSNDRLQARLDAIHRIDSKRKSSYDALIAAIPQSAERIRVVLLAADGDQFHIEANAPEEAAVDRYLQRLAAVKTIAIDHATRTLNESHAFAMEGHIRR